MTPYPPQTLQDHLGELRRRILVSLATVSLTVLAGFVWSVPMINLLKGMSPLPVTFIQLTPGEVLMVSVRLALYAGCALASPILLYQLLAFVQPGLMGRERQILRWILVAGSALFALGVWFAGWIVVPSTLMFLLDFGQQVAANQISIAQYVDLCLMMLVMTGVMFELPMVLFLLSLTGLVTEQQLISQWRQIVVGIAVASAILTPSQDPVTMLIVALAMAALYLLSLIPIMLVARLSKNRHPHAASAWPQPPTP
ncbi:MAG: twin-arginine translocase subunit TatC [Candidatus Melainabacteria bacterium]